MPVWWWLAGGILLANLLVLNDHNSFFSPVETEVMLAIRQTAPTWQDSPVESLYRLAMAGGDLLSWWARLPAAVLFVLALAGFYWLARPLLGKETGGLLLLALGSTLLAPNLAKTVCGDNWLLLVHGLALLASIRFLKDPKGKWLALTGGLIVLGAAAHFWGSVVLVAAWWSYLGVMHSNGGRLFSRRILLGAAVLLLLGWLGNWWQRPTTFFWMGYGRQGLGEYLLWQWGAWLPWIAFALPGCWDLLQRARRGEELALLLGGMGLSTLLAGSPAFQLVMALVVAKAVQWYFDPKYPYRNGVRSIAVLHLVLLFCAAAVGMMGGFLELGPAGFRLGMALGAAYWIPSFLLVIGLFGLRRRLVEASAAFGGLLLTLVFWTQAGPWLESYRGMPRELVQEAATWREDGEEVWFAVDDEACRRSLSLYGLLYLGAPPETTPERPSGLVLADRANRARLQAQAGVPIRETFQNGWSKPFQPDTLWLLRYSGGLIDDEQ